MASERLGGKDCGPERPPERAEHGGVVADSTSGSYRDDPQGARQSLNEMDSRAVCDAMDTLAITDPARAPGCPQCRSVCVDLDHCVVCRGESLCARCLYGPRVTEDEIHAVLVFDD